MSVPTSRKTMIQQDLQFRGQNLLLLFKPNSLFMLKIRKGLQRSLL